ncbi:MAG: LytR C-terminal domain-containing protein [Ignavibacteriaceae bacterium]|nr:LytR C-terminal domain-containing protein [Ignavibacteriaceae bacterium]
MKDKKKTDKLPNDVNLKTSSANLFLNSVIILLLLIISFLSYSLYSKISGSKTAIENTNTKTAADIVQMEVLNGCGAGGAADNFTSYLRNKNFDVVHTGNYISFDVDNSLVIDRTGNRANAEKVAEALGVSNRNIIQQINNDYFLDVTFVIGRDFNQLKPNKQ